MLNDIGLDNCLMPIRLQRIVSTEGDHVHWHTHSPQLISVGHESLCGRISKHNDVFNIPGPRQNDRRLADDTYESN